MTIRHLLDLLRRQWLVLVVTTLVGLAVAFLSTDRDTRYQAVALVHVGADDLGLQGSDELPLERIAVIDRLVLDYAALARATVPDHVVVAVSPGTQILQVVATTADPGGAADLANTSATALVEQVTAADTLPDGSDSGVVPTGIVVAVVQPATAPDASVDTELPKNLALGAASGLLLAVAGVLAVDAFRRDPDAEVG